MRLAEHDGELLRFYYDAGLTPGLEVAIARSDAAGSVTVMHGDAELLLTREQARGLYARPEGVPVVPAEPECWGTRGQQLRAVADPA